MNFCQINFDKFLIWLIFIAVFSLKVLFLMDFFVMLHFEIDYGITRFYIFSDNVVKLSTTMLTFKKFECFLIESLGVSM